MTWPAFPDMKAPLELFLISLSLFCNPVLKGITITEWVISTDIKKEMYQDLQLYL